MRLEIATAAALALFGLDAMSAGLARAAQVVMQPKAQFSEATFDKSNFRQLTAIAARKKCEDSLGALVALMEDATSLREEQIAQLKLAGQIDIHRFFYEYQYAKKDLKFGTISRNEWQATYVKARQKLQPLVSRYTEGLHGESSVFRKALSSVLSPEQFSDVQDLMDSVARAKYEDYIRSTLAIMDRKAPLSTDQRDQIVRLLLSKTTPPDSYGVGLSKITHVMIRMGEIEDELQKLFSEEEMKTIRQMIQSGKALAAQRQLIP